MTAAEGSECMDLDQDKQFYGPIATPHVQPRPWISALKLGDLDCQNKEV